MINTRDKLRRRVELLSDIQNALLQRRRLSWGSGERVSKSGMLRDVGLDLVSRTAAGKRGHVIKRGQKAVVLAYFGAPLQRYADLFIFGIQTKIRPKAK